MKRIIFVAALFVTTGSFAQKESGPLPYNKQKLDSLFRSFRELNLPYIFPVPPGQTFPEGNYLEKANSFEAANPGATVINETSRGTIYSMPLDNMPVLVPNMNAVENMPGSNRTYKPAPKSNMPNPLGPKSLPKKKDTNL